MKQISLYLIAFLLVAGSVFSQDVQQVSLDPDNWDINAQESMVLNYWGQKSLYLFAGQAYLKDVEFTNGIIEFDIAFTSRRGFMGIVWRVQDPANCEQFYFRPHQSGNPDANQYNPIFNGNSSWQLYHGEGYSVPTEYKFDDWMPVKLVISGKRCEIYIFDMEKPALVTHNLKQSVIAGQIGFTSGRAPAWIANLRYQKIDNPTFKGSPPEVKPAPEHSLMQWQVSNAFTEATLDKRYQLSNADKKNLTWVNKNAEITGIVNLSEVQTHRENDKNTAFARVVIHSDKAQVKKLQFGYSDRVKVYFNDRLMYSGTNQFRTRDYRYLGTIGLFDELYLPLKKGKNELWLAVSETFGGWGVVGKLDNIDGIRLAAGR